MNPNSVDLALPDTENWQPRQSAAGTLKSAFLKRCVLLEEEIQRRASAERSMNIDNYDSGNGVEDIIREGFKRILPTRYSIRAGVINDGQGNTAGDADLVVLNEIWFPIVKEGATEGSRRIHIPIEGVYAVGEIKQRLDAKVLDQAMEKLVVCHRLQRPSTFAFRVVENREGSACIHGLTNPLFTFIIATDLQEGVEFEDLVARFYHINKRLKRSEVINSLCVLGHGAVTWGYKEDDEMKPALFMLEDLYVPIIPVFHRKAIVESALYPLLLILLLHLNRSVLAPEDIAPRYGPTVHDISIPATADIFLEPDLERLSSLSHICGFEHNIKNAISNKQKKKKHKPL